MAEARSKAAALAKATEEAQRQLDAATQEAADESDDDSDEDESSEEESESEESSDDDDLSSFERAENRIHVGLEHGTGVVNYWYTHTVQGLVHWCVSAGMLMCADLFLVELYTGMY